MQENAEAPSNVEYAIDLARAFGGALLFSLPLLMTMEMWSLGVAMDRLRLLILLVLNVALLLGLSFFAGFHKTFDLKEDALDALAACGVGMIAAAVLLTVFGVIAWDMPAREIVGMVALQTVPASLGAMAARKQLDGDDEADEDRGGYAGQLFLMLAGALFLSFNVAPTEEMVQIAVRMTPWHALALVALSIVVLHAFVYSLSFPGQEERSQEGGPWRTFASYSLAGYGIALLVSLYMLWIFGRTDGVSPSQVAMMTAVLGFPAALGAAVARLVV